MKKLFIFLPCSIIVAFALPFFINTPVAGTLLGTLYTVAGVLFSVGMSIAISPKTGEVTNVDIKRRVRLSYKTIRDSFIAFFGMDTLLFVFSDIETNENIHDTLSMTCVSFTLFSIIYFVFNFIQLQKFGDEIEDQVLKEKAFSEQ